MEIGRGEYLDCRMSNRIVSVGMKSKKLHLNIKMRLGFRLRFLIVKVKATRN